MTDQNFAVGIDIHHAKPPLWPGFDFVILKASEGESWQDPAFTVRCQQAHMDGMAVGAYLFWRSEAEPRKQAENFLAQWRQAPAHFAAVDVERVSESYNPKTGREAEDLRALVDQLQAELDCPILVYTNVYSWHHFIGEKERGVLNDCGLWVAHWEAAAPLLPQGWEDWRLWQDGQISLNGERIDHNVFQGTAEELRLWLKLGEGEDGEDMGEPGETASPGLRPLHQLFPEVWDEMLEVLELGGDLYGYSDLLRLANEQGLDVNALRANISIEEEQMG